MIKTVILAGALLLSGPKYANEVEEPTTTETETETTEEETNFKEKIEQLIEDNERLKNIVNTCGVVYGALGGASFVSLVVLIVRTVYTSIKNKKIEQKTLEDVQNAVLNEVQKTVGQEVVDKIEEPIKQLTQTIVGMENLQKIIGQIVALSQEDSYKARLAILECIAGLHIIEPKIIEDAKEEIVKEQEQEKEDKEEANEQLDTIIEETSYSL